MWNLQKRGLLSLTPWSVVSSNEQRVQPVDLPPDYKLVIKSPPDYSPREIPQIYQ